MAPLRLPELNISPDSPNDDLKKLMGLVKPDWQQDMMEIKAMSGGFSCSTYHCYLTENPNEGVTVRVKKLFRKISIPFWPDGFEDKAVELVSKLGLFTQLLAIFQDGYCYQYIPGEVVRNIHVSAQDDSADSGLYCEENLKKIAENLVSINLAKMEGEECTKTEFYPTLLETLSKCYPADNPDLPEKSMVEEELKELTTYAEQMRPRVTFCHGDSHAGNIIWDKEKGKITFIDWECAAFGYQAYDVATFLRSFSTLESIHGAEKIVSDETVEKLKGRFVEFYFNDWNDKSEHKLDYQTFCDEVKYFDLAFPLILTVLVGGTFEEFEKMGFPMDSKQLTSRLMNEYMNMKPKTLAELKLKNMAPIKLPDFKIGEDFPEDNIRKLLQSVKPKWPQHAINIKKLSGGFSCSTYHCYLLEKPDKGVTVRVKTILFRMKRRPWSVEGFENKAVEEVSRLGIFPKVLAIFHDGYCYDYIPGEVMINFQKAKDILNLPLYEEQNLKRIAQKLVSIHMVKMDGEDYSKTDYLLLYLDAAVTTYPDLADIPNKNMLQDELKKLKKYADQLQLQVSLSHGDSHPGNMILNKDTGEITFIDWELATIGYQAFDIAYFLRMFTLLENTYGPELRPTKEWFDKMEEKFLNFYYAEWSQKCVPKIDFNRFCNEVKFFKLAYFVMLTVILGSLLDDAVTEELPMESKSTMNGLMKQYFATQTTVLQDLNLLS